MMRYELNINRRYLLPDSEIGGLTYSSQRSLPNAIRIAGVKSGIYKIYQKGSLIYIGETGNLRKRLMQHHLCVHRFNAPGPITVKYAYFSGSKSNRVRIQNDIINYYRNRKGFNITNIREIEEELVDGY
jgi:predicted GIY-YIG superfamily endonuclease